MGVGHDHSVVPGDESSGRFRAVLGISIVGLAVQLVGAAVTGSLALLADAGHLLTDVMGLSMAVLAATLSRRAANRVWTWGLRRAEVLAAAAQAVLLGAVACYVFVEGVRRLLLPPPVAPARMLVFGVFGLIMNGIAIALLSASRGGNLNTRAAFLEVVNDALGSAAVIVAAVVIDTTGWLRADAVVSLLVGLLILPRAVVILREASAVLLESTPKGLDLDEVRRHILQTGHVHEVHDLHASQIATGLPVLTAHVVVDDSCFLNGHLPRLLDELQGCVTRHFPVSVEHSTFQFEPLSHQGHEAPTHR